MICLSLALGAACSTAPRSQKDKFLNTITEEKVGIADHMKKTGHHSCSFALSARRCVGPTSSVSYVAPASVHFGGGVVFYVGLLILLIVFLEPCFRV